MQLTLSGAVSVLDSTTRYGDNPDWKAKGMIRDVFCNMNGMLQAANNEKDPLLWSSLHKLRADSAGIAETNLDWRLMAEDARMHARAKLAISKPVKVATAHNTKATPLHKSQWGGVATVAFAALVPRVISTDKDPMGLGRWLSFLIKGKGNNQLVSSVSFDGVLFGCSGGTVSWP